MAVVAVTGHRPPRVGGYRIPNPAQEIICDLLAQQLVTLSPELVLIGMAIGVDQWAAEICIEQGIPWDAIIPFHGYEHQWPPHAQQHYRQLLAYANSQHVVTNTHAYNSNLLYRRNAWMVDHSDLLLAVWNGQPSGTANAVQYAQRRGKQVRVVPVDQATWDLAARLGLEDEQRRATFREARAAAPPLSDPRRVPIFQGREIISPDTGQIVGDVGEQIQLRQFPEGLREHFRQFIGMQATPENLQRLQAAMLQYVSEQAATAMRRPFLPQPMEERAHALDPFLDPLYGREAEGEDRTTTAAAEDAREPVQEPTKEIITPEKRFRPGRVIHIDDE